MTPNAAPELISVVIPNLDGEETIGEQMQALSNQDYQGDWEVVVSDNGSTDGSLEVAEEWRDSLPSLQIVDASEKRGINTARNIGAFSASGDFIVFCDNDDVVSPGWLAAMARAAESYDLVGGWIEQEKLNREVAGWRTEAPRDRLPVALDFLPFAPGGNLGIWASVFSDLGGWDESRPGGTEDENFSFRASVAGYQIGFASDAVLHYRHREGLGGLAQQQFRYAREEVRLFRDYKRRGASRSSLRLAMIEWAWLVWHLPDLYGSTQDKATWIRKGSVRFGRLMGSLRYRTLYL